MQIDKNIPMPQGHTWGKPEAKANTLLAMEFGDSVFFSDKKEAHSFRATGCQYKRRGKLKPNARVAMRKVEGGYRVWLIEDKHDTSPAIPITESESEWLESVEAMSCSPTDGRNSEGV